MFSAGAFGGAIGSNIPIHTSYDDLAKPGAITVFRIPMPKLEWCIHLEHFFFWAGVLPLFGRAMISESGWF